MSGIVIAQRFCGPPSSGNGGYCAGLLARGISGPATAVLKARIPLDVPLDLAGDAGRQVLASGEGEIIGEGAPADREALPDVPPPPTWDAAVVAEARHIGIGQRFHPICFSCGPERGEGDGLRVFAGQLEGEEEGRLACTWTPHANFADAGGLIPTEVIWAALDCPGFFAWVVREGRHGALPGTMTGLLLAGVDPLEAVQVQLAVMFLILGGVAITSVIVARGVAGRLVTPDERLDGPRTA